MADGFPFAMPCWDQADLAPIISGKHIIRFNLLDDRDLTSEITDAITVYIENTDATIHRKWIRYDQLFFEVSWPAKKRHGAFKACEYVDVLQTSFERSCIPSDHFMRLLNKDMQRFRDAYPDLTMDTLETTASKPPKAFPPRAGTSHERGKRHRTSSLSSSNSAPDATRQQRSKKTHQSTSPTPSLPPSIVAKDAGPPSQAETSPPPSRNPPQDSASSLNGNGAAPEHPPQQRQISFTNEHKEPQLQPPKFRPRKHPATFRVNDMPPTDEVTCLLFRPRAGASLQTADKKLISLGLQQLQPAPSAVRKIRDGGLAVDFPLNLPLAHIKQLTTLGGIPITVEPPRTKPGSSGIIRGDFSAAEEVHDLYIIHPENPAITAVTQLGDNAVFKLDFCGNRPQKLRMFHNIIHVEPYFQQPLRCFQCSGFGHKADVCKRPPSCSLCASHGHTYKTCPRETTKCINCGGSHPAIAKSCPHRLYLLSSAKTAATKGISIHEARNAAALSYAAALKTSPNRQVIKTQKPANPRPTHHKSSDDLEPTSHSPASGRPQSVDNHSQTENRSYSSSNETQTDIIPTVSAETMHFVDFLLQQTLHGVLAPKSLEMLTNNIMITLKAENL